MKIHISKLQRGVNQLQVSIKPVDFDLDEINFNNTLNIKLEIEKLVGKVDLKMSIETTATLLCDRCGEEFSRPLTAGSSVLFIQREQPLPDEMPGDDMRSYSPGQDELEITQDIRDSVLLSLPYKRLCKEDCKGLCPKCGVNWNFEQCSCPAVLIEE